MLLNVKAGEFIVTIGLQRSKQVINIFNFLFCVCNTRNSEALVFAYLFFQYTVLISCCNLKSMDV
jgi:hypothetical protein